MKLIITRYTQVSTRVEIDVDKDWEKFKKYCDDGRDLDDPSSIDLASKEDFISAFKSGEYEEELSTLFEFFRDTGICHEDQYGDEDFQSEAE